MLTTRLTQYANCLFASLVVVAISCQQAKPSCFFGYSRFLCANAFVIIVQMLIFFEPVDFALLLINKSNGFLVCDFEKPPCIAVH